LRARDFAPFFAAKRDKMHVTAWNNGQHYRTGAGYGFKLRADDRDRHFKKTWTTVFVALPGVAEEVEFNINKSSFWGGTCRELINRVFGQWLIQRGYAPWSSGAPPKFDLVLVRANHFKLADK
jgi:hypothetical protein